MKRLGSCLHTVGSVAVVRSELDSRPPLDVDVIDSSLDRVGKTVDVFGPVTKPYVSVTVDESRDIEPGSKLYIRD
ncbi:MAG: Gar1/Naf1 family protein [Halobacteria archaeon]|nr:Gar1/Naf1 family protein [Halobacteria archaeon]